MKKILALLVACLMLTTIVVVSSAATYEVTMSASNLTVEDYIDDEEGSGYYAVVVALDNVPVSTTNADMSQALNAYEIYLKYDATKVRLHSWAGGAIDGGIGYEYKNKGKWYTASYTTDVVEYDSGVIQIVASTTADGATTDKAFGTGEIAEVYFEPLAGATGKVDIEFVLSATHSSGTGYKTLMSTKSAVGLEAGVDFNVANGSIDLGGEEEPDEPVATTVKTFAKRLYLDNTLYTVGVISEGTDYATETIKAGIRIDKAGVMVPYWTNNAPVSDGKGTSYYAVALNGVTAETDIKAESVSKAVITVNGGAEISGDEVSANDTSVE